MVGYKVFTPEWTAVCGKGGRANPFQYHVGEVYEQEEPPIARRTGFHFCKNLTDCFRYYEVKVRNRIAELEILGEVSVSGDACATNKMRIVREIPWREAVEIAEKQMRGE